MPYKTVEQQRQFQAIWMWRRRMSWILENGPCRRCGSTRDLRVVYGDPKMKTVKVSSIWSLSDERRQQLLKYCIVLCATCALNKLREERPAPEHGTPGRYKQGCKCTPCKEAKSKAMATYRARKKERAMPERR